MAIWIALFTLTFIISLIMAYRSMSDYYEQASNFPVTYSQYLVGNPEGLTAEILRGLHNSAYDSRFILSFERLFKGSRRALVIFGPTTILHTLVGPLKLTELEDYSKRVGEVQIKSGEVATWGMGRKKGDTATLQTENFFVSLPELLESEEFWWQIVLQPKGSRESGEFESTIRAVLLAGNSARATTLKSDFSKLGQEEGLAETPKAHTTEEFLKLYSERALPKEYTQTITPEEVLSLVEA